MLIYKKKLLNCMLFGYGGLMLLLVLLLTGSMLMESNVLFQSGIWLNVVAIFTSVVDIFAFAVAAAILIYGIYLVGTRELTTVYAAFLCMTVFHYVAVLCIGWLVFPGTLPESVDDLLSYLFEDVIVFVFLDCLRIFVVGLVTARLLAKREAERKEYNRKANIIGKEMQSKRSVAFPFAGFFRFKNPLQAGVLTMAIVYWMTFYIQYVYYDIMTLIKLDYFYGASFQILTLLANAALACIGYTVVTFILIKMDEKMPKTD